MHNIITRGLGAAQALVTRGYGKVRAVFKGSGGGIYNPYDINSVFEERKLCKFSYKIVGSKKFRKKKHLDVYGDLCVRDFWSLVLRGKKLIPESNQFNLTASKRIIEGNKLGVLGNKRFSDSISSKIRGSKIIQEKTNSSISGERDIISILEAVDLI